MTMNDEDTYTLEEMLLVALICMAPQEAKEILVQRLRQYVSIKAGDIAEEAMVMTKNCFITSEEMFEDFAKNRSEEFAGECLPRTSLLTDVRARLKAATDRLGLDVDIQVLDHTHESTSRYVEPTPGCGCPRCLRIIALGKKGIKIDVQTGDEINLHNTN